MCCEKKRKEKNLLQPRSLALWTTIVNRDHCKLLSCIIFIIIIITNNTKALKPNDNYQIIISTKFNSTTSQPFIPSSTTLYKEGKAESTEKKRKKENEGEPKGKKKKKVREMKKKRDTFSQKIQLPLCLACICNS